MLKKIIIVFISIFVFFQSSVYANSSYFNENSASSIYSNNVSSVLYIETQDSSGSGVILKEDGTFVTCFHVIANADYIMAKLEDGSIYYVNGFRYINPLSDVAILTLDTTRKFTPIAINPMNNLKIGEKVYAISNPQGLQFVFSDGMINQYTKDYIQFSAPISSGSSGGALLNRNGYLLGIITSQFNPSESQNINFALPNEYYASKINNSKIINEKGVTWTDFLISKITNDEFSLYMQYAFNNSNLPMLYKYLNKIVKGKEIPPQYLTSLGYLALSAYVLDGYSNFEYVKDAVNYYSEDIIKYNYNLEASFFATAYLSMNTEDFDAFVNNLNIYYPKSYEYLINLTKRYNNCRIDDVSCFYEIDLDFLDYLGNITDQNGKDKEIFNKKNQEFYIKAYKKILNGLSQAIHYSNALLEKDITNFDSEYDFFNQFFLERFYVIDKDIDNYWRNNTKGINCGTDYAFMLNDGMAICINKFVKHQYIHLYVDVNGNNLPNKLTIDSDNPQDIYEIILQDNMALPYRNVDKKIFEKIN